MEDKIDLIIEKLGEVLSVYDLDNEMNIAFSKFVNSFFSTDCRFDSINATLYPGFEKEIFNYLDRRYLSGEDENYSKQDYLFNNLGAISNIYMGMGLLIDCQKFWVRVLQSVTIWEEYQNKRVHKGSIFYFWAYASLINGELDKGFFLIHKAYLEDCLTHKTETPGTPAYKSVSMNYQDDANLLYNYIIKLWEFLGIYIDNYNNENGKKISQEQIYINFISSPPSNDILFSFTHSLAKIQQLEQLQELVTNSGFAGLYELNILFDLVLIIDNLIFYKSPNPKNIRNSKFKELAKKVLIDSQLECNAGVAEANLISVNVCQNNDFDLTVSTLVNKTFNFPSSSTPPNLYYDISLCYCIRNHSAHNISLTDTISNNFNEITQSVLNVLFLCIETYS